MKAKYRIVSKIYEDGLDYPVVVHTFYGKTLAEARRYFQAHLKADSFFRGCTVDHKFGNFKCREDRKSEFWNGREWVAA